MHWIKKERRILIMIKNKQIPFWRTYEINTSGEVIKSETNRIIKNRINQFGFLEVSLNCELKTTVKKIHRLLAENFIPNPNNFKHVRHIDGNRLNNNLNNLEWSVNKIRKENKNVSNS